jgi:AraC-like DNA-binding protein
MTLRVHCPGPPLDRFIACFWHNAGEMAGHRRERLLPTGSFALVFRLAGEPLRRFADERDGTGTRLPDAAVLGVHASYALRDTSVPRTTIGVHFRPGGAAALLGFPARLVTGLTVGLEDLWEGAGAGVVHARLVEAATPEARFAVLAEALSARLAHGRRQNPAVSYALRRLSATPALARISPVRVETGYGPKRFIELFTDAVGLTPKLLCRVQRFQAAIELLARGAPVEWAAVAADDGFADQSHLNREFRAFAGITPGAYRPVAPDRPNHVALAE